MIYWILTDPTGAHGRTHDGDWEPLLKRQPASDDVERFHRHRDALAKARKLKAKGCPCKPLKQEGICFFWHLPAAPGDKTDMVDIIEFRLKRQADAWRKRAIAEGCEVIECEGTARPPKRKSPKRGAPSPPNKKPGARSKRGGQRT